MTKLITLVNSFNLAQGIANSLDSKLQNALNALSAANAGDRANIIVTSDHGFALHNARVDIVDSLVATGLKKTRESSDVVITGVTRGLGRALVEGLVPLGHRVVGCGRWAEEIENLRREHGLPHAFEVVDVADDAARRGCVRLCRVSVRRWASGPGAGKVAEG